MSEIAIRVEHISKQYRIGGRAAASRTLREVLSSAAKAPVRWLKGQGERPETFWALDDVSLEVKQGEALGIIGRNGSGKSTLLKILSHITQPTRGRVDLYGRVGSLLEVGTGFHTELTGRENIYLNGAILGMSRREMQRKFDQIVDFAEVEKFLDTPVKYYSSGMYVRLAFAVAAHLEPEILVVDEVLAVGDASFQEKSMGKMSEVAHQGRTVLFVSHQMNAIEAMCSSAILLEKGKLIGAGSPKEVIANYLSKQERNNWQAGDGPKLESPYFTPTQMYLVNKDLKRLGEHASANDKIGVVIEGDVSRLHSGLTVGFAVYASTGELLLHAQHTDVEKEKWPPIRIGHNKLVGWIPAHFLNEGDYRVELFAKLYNWTSISQPGLNAPFIAVQVRGELSQSPYWVLARPGLTAPILHFELLD